MLRHSSLKYAIFGLVALVIAAAVWALAGGPSPLAKRGPLGLFTSLPLYWGEEGAFSDLLDPDAEPHWARVLVEEHRELRPLDVLSPQALDGLQDLLLAQPRALSASENVALDEWVRGGGRLLSFADPLLTEESHFPLGDRRRPLDVVLLSPILNRWGLELHLDEQQSLGARNVRLAGINLPVDLPGQLALIPTAPDAPADCELLAQGVGADCRIGSGRVLVIADAALLARHGGEQSGNSRALSGLMTKAYAAD